MQEDAGKEHPSLHLHDRRAVGAAVAAIEARALFATFGRGVPPTPTARLTAERLLAHVRERQDWLACGCRGPDIEPPPLMTPRLRAGTLHLWRHGSTPHDPGCPLWAAPGEAGPRPGAQDASGLPQLIILRPPRPGGAQDRKRPTEGLSPRPERSARLPDLLHALLAHAGYTHVMPEDVKTFRGRAAVSARRDAYAGLDALAEMPVTGDLTWRELACTFLPALPRHAAHLAGLAGRFPASVRPQGYFLGVIDGVERAGRGRGSLVWSAGKDREPFKVQVEGRIQGEADTPGPLWTLALLAPSAAAGGAFVPIRAAVVPCLSRSVLLPLAAASERALAEVLLRQVAYWARPEGFAHAVALERDPHAPGFNLWLAEGRRILVLLEGGQVIRGPDIAATLTYEPANTDPARFARVLTAVFAKEGGGQGSGWRTDGRAARRLQTRPTPA